MRLPRNYLGFPAGIDVGTSYDLMHDHAETAGCDVVAEAVESVDRDGDGFVVTTGAGEAVTARRVVAATRYGGDYLRGLDDERRVELRERAIDRRFGTYLADGEVDRRTDRGHERLLERVDDVILDAARRSRPDAARRFGSDPIETY